MWSPNAFTSSSSSSSSLEESTDDEDELDYDKNLTIQSVIILGYLLIIGKFDKKIHCRRNKMVEPFRMDWCKFSSRHPDMIERTLRMSMESFQSLVAVLENDLMKSEKEGKGRGGSISPEIRIFIFIRYASGASYLDISLITGASTTTVYKVIGEVRDAINASWDPKLDNIHFPRSREDCKKIAKEFEDRSFGQAVVNCVSVVDGYLLKIIAPGSNVVGNQRSYFSGHYACFGLNVQAACDIFCRFTFLGVAGPGVLPDRVAIHEVELMDLIEGLPGTYVVIGDPAYPATEHLVPLFFGESVKRPEHDAFNYYASQCRIRIEMAFGLMTQKWGLFQRPFSGHLLHLPELLKAIGRLHNYTINERLDREANLTFSIDSIYYNQPSTIHTPAGVPVDFIEDDCNVQLMTSGISMVRFAMVDRVKHLGLKRPSNSVLFTDK